MSTKHPEISDRLFLYLDGLLDQDLRRQVQEHLESCGSCSEELAAIRAIAGAIRQAGRANLAATAVADRYGCPGSEELALHALKEPPDLAEGDDWIRRHLEACPRCLHEFDLIRLVGRELQEATAQVAPQDLSQRVEARLLARVSQGKGGEGLTSFFYSLPWLSTRFVTRATVGVGLAAAVAVWALLRVQHGPTMIAERSPEQEARAVQPSVSSPVLPQQQPRESPKPTTRVAPTPAEAPSPQAPSPRMIAKVEPPALLSAPSVAPVELAPPSGAAPAREAPTAPSVRPGLPPLVPAKQGEALKMVILPIPNRPGLRSAVAAALQDRLATVQPPEREFPPEASVDDLTANRRLGRLLGVHYVLEIGVREKPSGYLVVLRAADTETGGIVAKREALASDEGALSTVAGRLARELQDELKARP